MRWIVALTVLVAMTAARAADIRIVTEEVLEGDLTRTPAVIEVTGKLDESDGAVFDGRTAGIRRATVYLHSVGGSARGGVELGQIIRARGFVTAVANRNICYSACAIAWLGGRKRFIGYSAAVGFHAPFDKEGHRGAVAEAAIDMYMTNLGLHKKPWPTSWRQIPRT